MSSLFFPKKTFEKVSIVYAWVRVADNFVDVIPQDKKSFFAFRSDFELVWNGKHNTKSTYRQLHEDFVGVAKEYDFEKEWLDAFLDSMEMDLTKRSYTYVELKLYMYGSAEVIGLMMSRLLGLDKSLDSKAKDLGRAMQLINFIRDVKEDTILGRKYLQKKNNNYIVDYRKWDASARTAFCFIPYRYRVPIKTAADMYLWTAEKIEQNPTIPYRYKLKPSKLRVIFTGIKNGIIEIFKGKNS